ncbi:MAG: lysylphosphatidylglycerol synthase transmembrane domain-containing protein [Patescibacteria group bacterium]
MKIKKISILILRIVVSFLVLYLVFLKIDFRVFSLTFSKIKIGYIILAFLVCGLQFLISTTKWKKLVDYFKIRLGFKFYLKFNFIALFYATIMPGGIIAGDLIKGYKIFKISKDRKIIINSILMDRITGFLGLIILIIFLFFVQSVKFPHHTEIILIAMILLLLIFTFLIFFQKIFNYLLKVIKKKTSRLGSLLEKTLKAVNTYSNNPVLLIFAVLISILIYLINTLCVYFVVLAVGIHVPFINILVINCLVNFAIIVAPITFAGFGIREGFFVYFLGLVGVTKEFALISSLSLGFIYLFLSLGGGALELRTLFIKNKIHNV